MGERLLVAVLYAKKWLTRPNAPLFSLAELGWVDRLADWEPVPASALPPAPEGRG